MAYALRYLGLAACLFSTLAVSRAAPPDGPIKLAYLYASPGYSASQRFNHPSGAFYDSVRDELYVADTGNGQIVILDKRGNGVAKLRHFIADPKTGDRHPGEPRCVAVRKNRDILVIDNLVTYVDILDAFGRSVQKFWPADLIGKPRESVRPRYLALDAAGNIYLAIDGSAKEILVLGPDLRLRTQFGAESTGRSKGITGLWVGKDGRVFASYATGVAVQVFNSAGSQLCSFGEHDSGPNNFSLPSGLVTDSLGRIWALDTIRHAVSVFKPVPVTSGAEYTFHSLTIGGMGDMAGELLYPSGIAGDGVSRLYIVESAGARVQGFEVLTQ